MSHDRSKIIFQEAPRDYRTEIPNIILDLLASGQLSPKAFVLYSVYRRIAGEHGACWIGTRGLAEKCQFSTPTITKLKRELSKPLKDLGGKSLIQITPGDPRKEEADLVTIIDVWQDNFNHFKNNLTCVKTRHGGVSNFYTPLCKNKTHKKEPYKNPPPLSSSTQPLPLEEKSKQHISLRSEEEEIITYKILENTTLSPKEKQRLTRSYSEQEVTDAIEIAKFQTVKKSLMGLLLNILKTPDKWEKPDKRANQSAEKEPYCESDRRQLAMEYNALLENEKDNIREVKVLSKNGVAAITVDLKKISKENTKTIVEEDFLFILSGDFLHKISIKSNYFIRDIKKFTGEFNNENIDGLAELKKRYPLYDWKDRLKKSKNENSQSRESDEKLQ